MQKNINELQFIFLDVQSPRSPGITRRWGLLSYARKTVNRCFIYSCSPWWGLRVSCCIYITNSYCIASSRGPSQLSVGFQYAFFVLQAMESWAGPGNEASYHNHLTWARSASSLLVPTRNGAIPLSWAIRLRYISRSWYRAFSRHRKNMTNYKFFTIKSAGKSQYT